MHSRYHSGFRPVEEPGRFEEPPPPQERAAPKPEASKLPILGRNFNISGLLKNFKIDWDAGDILLVLILLFLFLESDDEEILIMLALILFMGF